MVSFVFRAVFAYPICLAFCPYYRQLFLRVHPAVVLWMVVEVVHLYFYHFDIFSHRIHLLFLGNYSCLQPTSIQRVVRIDSIVDLKWFSRLPLSENTI